MSSAEPCVSVVIPVFNSGRSAVKAIDSVMRQGPSILEVVVVDDGSEDDSVVILENYIAHLGGNKIRLIRQTNTGAASARNSGITACRGEFIGFLDSDDLWLPGKVDAQLRVFRANLDVGLVGTLTNCNMSIFNKTCKSKSEHRVSYFGQLLSNRFQTSTVMLRSSVLENVGGFPEYQRYAEEGDLFLRIVFRFKSILISEVLVDYAGGKPAFGSAGLSGNLVEMWLGELKNLKRAYERREVGAILYGALNFYSAVKFMRRLLVVKIAGLVNRGGKNDGVRNRT